MIDEIVKSTREACAVLERIKSMPREELEKAEILPLLRNAVNLKLMIQEDTQTDIRKLVIMSIKRQDLQKGNLPDDVIQREIKKYDCHQTSLAAQKKVLLLMFIEKELGIVMGDDEATDIESLDELAEAVIRHLKGGG
ncbi:MULTISPECIES: hypothetical protein [unclassified Clostridium]|uniref:hypothetical protein n=1 Tax=unclassified Clostridium TaxID=2614128 RepID=UPI00110582A3|nr:MULTISPECIES: hypothetical protein [unclassified Clostridium]